MPSPTIIVLAAGRGSRFGGPRHKLEQPLGGGTVIDASLRHVIETALPLVVVTTGALRSLVAAQVAGRDMLVLSDAEADRGMGHSIAVGVAARPDADGWLIAPADMPLIRPATYLAVARALVEHPVAYGQFQGRRGHPVGFAAELYSELVTLDGDEGARRLVARYPACGVDVDDPGVLMDVDTEADLSAVQGLAAPS